VHGLARACAAHSWHGAGLLQVLHNSRLAPGGTAPVGWRVPIGLSLASSLLQHLQYPPTPLPQKVPMRKQVPMPRSCHAVCPEEGKPAPFGPLSPRRRSIRGSVPQMSVHERPCYPASVRCQRPGRVLYACCSGRLTRTDKTHGRTGPHRGDVAPDACHRARPAAIQVIVGSVNSAADVLEPARQL
jgi:hypothetical protein